MNNVISQVNEYFEACKNYWIQQGNTERVATAKAFYWDCVECWNFDKSWNDAKREFARTFNYNEGDQVPSAELVERGLC